jgi:hypothetical protein
VTEGQFVSLISSDDFEFVISRKCALESGTIKNMLSGPGKSCCSLRSWPGAALCGLGLALLSLVLASAALCGLGLVLLSLVLALSCSLRSWPCPALSGLGLVLLSLRSWPVILRRNHADLSTNVFVVPPCGARTS